jgi:hypothetical protein
MTLIVAVNRPESIWLLADRRLTRGGRPTAEKATKLMLLTTKDAVAILGYAGLGATGLGTEPAQWMSAVLRGQPGLTLKDSLRALTAAMIRRLPRHVVRLTVPRHTVVVTSFVGGEVRLYSIDLTFENGKGGYRLTRHVRPGRRHTTSIAVIGSGSPYLLNDTKWTAPLLRLVRAHDRGQLSALAVATHLAKLNYEVHSELEKKGDKTVGPRCVVAWKHRPGGVHKQDGGAYQFFAGGAPDYEGPDHVPILDNGFDTRAMIDALAPEALAMFESMRTGEPPSYPAETASERLARIPTKPDDTLR